MEALMTDELARLEGLKAGGHAIRDEELELANSELIALADGDAEIWQERQRGLIPFLRSSLLLGWAS